MQFPISRNILVHENDKLNMEFKNDWKPFSAERKEEIQGFHDSLVHNQLTRNHFSHGWKQTYKQINDFCDTFCIPSKSRNKFYINELEFLSLFIHDILPEGYNEEGICQNDPSISRYTLFLREDYPISIAWKKLLDFIIHDYIFFWDVFSNKIKFGELQDQDFIKLRDLFAIITFNNPQAI